MYAALLTGFTRTTREQSTTMCAAEHRSDNVDRYAREPCLVCGRCAMRLGMLIMSLTVAAATTGCAGAGDPTLVETRQGTVKGVLDGDLKIFKGIPYAAPPVGSL